MKATDLARWARSVGWTVTDENTKEVKAERQRQVGVMDRITWSRTGNVWRVAFYRKASRR